LLLLAACQADSGGPPADPGPVADDDDAGDDDTGDDDATDDGRITYNDEIQPLLDLYCGACHSGNPPESCMGESCFSNHYAANLYGAYSPHCDTMNKAECGLYRIEATLKNLGDANPRGGPREHGDDDSAGCEPVGPNEFDCADGIDEDCDGHTDCDDSADCELDAACLPSSDDDDSADCATPGNLTEFNCADGIDEDCDGLVDCYDALDCGLDSDCNGEDPGTTFSETDVLRYPDGKLIIVELEHVEMIREWIIAGMPED